MLNAFKKFGFGPDLTNWVAVLMSDTKSCISYCGWISDSFSVESGIRQGCPFSSLAFILSIELLAIKIRHSSNIKGVRHQNRDTTQLIKIALYADDITLFLTDEKDLQNATEIINQFSEISGLILNSSKSEAMWLGSNKQRLDIPCGFALKSQLKILGVYFSAIKQASMIEDNWL